MSDLVEERLQQLREEERERVAEVEERERLKKLNRDSGDIQKGLVRRPRKKPPTVS